MFHQLIELVQQFNSVF